MALLAAGGATFAKEHLPVKLRKWQAEATLAAVTAFKGGRRLSVTEGCTGSGKTAHGCQVAVELHKSDQVDLTIVLTPTIATKNSWKAALAKSGSIIKATDDIAFPIDTNAWVSTYGGFEAVKTALTTHPIRRGIFLIVDEYHHAEEDASWGRAVSSLGDLAKHILLLSGTPWRRSGVIAFLSGQRNIKGNPYYEENSNRVHADYVHDYKTDLRSGLDRATTLVQFELYESIFTDTKTGKQEMLIKPSFEDMTPDDMARWEDEAVNTSLTLGKHVRITDPLLTGNKLAKQIIEWSVQMLEKSRAETFRHCRVKDLTVMLVVAQNIKEAKYLRDYIEEVYDLRAEVIVSDNADSNERLEEVRRKCQDNARDKPDVIVSVGMISEGVDIPQIKVIAYLSAILTTLYLIQVIGRALRRISVSADKFADNGLHDTLAYVAAPAHPKICYIARRIEEQMADALKASSSPTEQSPTEPPREFAAGTVDTTEDVLSILRGQVEQGAKWREVVEQMRDSEKAADCYLDANWCEYVLGLALRGTKESTEKAQQLAHDMCECLGLEFATLWGHVANSGNTTLTYDQEQKLLRRQAQYLTNLVRWKTPPFAAIEDNDIAYQRVRSYLNRISGIGSIGFPKASLNQKRDWIRCAEMTMKAGACNEQL